MAIDWNHWLKCRTLHEIEVVLLTLGFDPENHQIGYLDGHYLVTKSVLKEKQKEFIKRIGFIQDYRFKSYEYMNNDGEWGNYFADGYNNKILVKRFLLWLKNEDFGWDLPKEITEFISGLSDHETVKTNSKGRPPALTKEQEEKLVETHIKNPKISQDSLGEMFNVTRNTVGNILKKHGKK